MWFLVLSSLVLDAQNSTDTMAYFQLSQMSGVPKFHRYEATPFLVLYRHTGVIFSSVVYISLPDIKLQSLQVISQGVSQSFFKGPKSVMTVGEMVAWILDACKRNLLGSWKRVEMESRGCRTCFVPLQPGTPWLCHGMPGLWVTDTYDWANV